MKATVWKALDVSQRLCAELAAGRFGVKLLDQSVGLGYGIIVTHLKDRKPKPEMHDNADDVFYILEGNGTLSLGGEIQQRAETSPGEHLGESLTGAQSFTVTAGDVISIPRKTPHMMGCPGGEVKYLVVKVY